MGGKIKVASSYGKISLPKKISDYGKCTADLLDFGSKYAYIRTIMALSSETGMALCSNIVHFCE